MNLREILVQDYMSYYEKDRVTLFDLVGVYFDTLRENRTLSYIITMRLCTYFDKNNRIILQFFRYRLRKLQLKFGLEISYKSRIGAGFKISHGFGIVIHPNTVIGDNCTILQNRTIGNNMNKSRSKVAVLGNNVFIGAGAKIIGPVTVGDNVIIGANTVIISGVPSNSVVAGVPGRLLKHHSQTY